jgi:hypothetical protein
MPGSLVYFWSEWMDNTSFIIKNNSLFTYENKTLATLDD